jgi:hypothetical protein
MFRWVRRALLVVALVVLVGGGILALTARPDLDNARQDAETRWNALRRPALDARYELLASVNDALEASGGPRRDIIDEVDEALRAWQTNKRSALDAQVRDANELEALGRRLTRAITTSARLKAIPQVLTPANRYRTAEVPEAARGFNRAVADYEDERSGTLREPIAGLLGFDPIPTYDAPAAAPA